ncbi:FliM/FliN family flagellar motor switch protein [Halarcobacter bivalviorum]|uniref:FliM/FliN family flagellar motor switch protein n=1 Tax=Halarcobacter bivalviorum TaxID=663364 RepID=UPI00100A2C9D|nr:FliM/FliN family flagellar motor switch protein [Halarcobacter bivalviorum]RXK05303.1 flagellar motor switch protein FliY [Halarcobacter bivalviorum]
MASDLSSFLKDELANTLEQLLSKSTTVDSVSALDVSSLDDSQCIEVSVKFEFSTISSIWKFYIPSITATKFEYFMLGGMGDLKEHIDDEIADAVNEIISNVCGSLCTSINAQGFPDVSSIKSEVAEFSIKVCSDIEDSDNIYTLDLSLDGEKLPIYLLLDEIILPYLSSITGYDDSADVNNSVSAPAAVSAPSNQAPNSAATMGPNVSTISSLLSEESAENLQLLFNIKLKLSVRLGTKNFLLKDILRWDIGEIIELEQMVNEPLDILVNGVKIGEGEAVIVEGKFGLKIKNIGDSSMKLSQIGM